MKKLEKLKEKKIQRKNLISIIGGILVPDYTVDSTHCEISNNTPSYDCSDESRDKDK